MGAATSSGLVDSVVDGDIQALKSILQSHEVNPSDVSVVTKDSAWNLELEEAVHTVVGSELESGQHLQQLLIALELLLQAQPEAWSSTASSQEFNENNDDTSATSNSAGWSACHRACATGNLAFIAFVLQHHQTQFDIQIRDTFGLFPIDLVPPELLMSASEIDDNLREHHDVLKPGTARTRRCLALQHLRERKAYLQDQHVRRLLGDPKSECPSTANNQDEERTSSGHEFYVEFEPRRDHLSIDQVCNIGHVHERGALLRVNYRLPRAEPFLDGYFQLIWRELGDPRSEEPHYDSHVTRLRDDKARFLDLEAPLQPGQSTRVLDSQGNQAETKELPISRSLDDPGANSVIEGYFPIDVTHLPVDSVCHVVFIACDRHMMNRTIALSTEGLAVQLADIGDSDSDDYYSDSTSEDDYKENVIEEKQEVEVKQPGYTFFVGGEEFSHPNSVFAGQSFPDVESFENFLRDVRVKKQRRLQEKQEQHERPTQQSRHQSDAPELQQLPVEADPVEKVTKSEGANTPATRQEDEVRPAENPSDNPERGSSNQDDEGTGK
ncbi:hypothetical protein PHMEG_0001091 [Phytophthora megakarya]|uniref:Uncharacterized protein n=1 Tax=Phytophthora megakarya TaxID=4795 RepID=A0A225X3Z2_9STRA|nr:hypothetical protein PHMEG_0001091 [Phytophthora megakarya]